MLNVIRKLRYKLVPKPVSQEVLEVFAASPNIKKLGRNDVEDFDYLMILTICRTFKDDLFERGIVITAKDIECSFEQISEEGRFTLRCVVRTKFEARRKVWFGTQWCNLGEALGAGRDESEMIALSTAQTFAFKAMLKRSSMTYGENEDVEATKHSPEDSPTAKETVRIKTYQQRALSAALRDSGVDPKALSEQMSKALGFQISCAQIADLPRTEFDQAMKIILGFRNAEDLTEKWGNALECLKAGKQQPVINIADAQREIGAN